MCLAIPGKIERVSDASLLTRPGLVNFDGVVKEVSLALVPEAAPGDYVIVHAGLALSRVDETEARQVFAYLAAIKELGEIEDRAR
jgi:hydrogenase expression/formation protein HypC